MKKEFLKEAFSKLLNTEPYKYFESDSVSGTGDERHIRSHLTIVNDGKVTGFEYTYSIGKSEPFFTSAENSPEIEILKGTVRTGLMESIFKHAIDGIRSKNHPAS